MRIFDSLHSVYDRKACDCHCCECQWEVIEAQKGVSFKKLTLCLDGATFGVIDDDFYKGIQKMTSDRSSFLYDKNCDGVSFCEYEGTLHLLFVELKSNFSEIQKAFIQDFFTLMKMHMFLSICKDYNLENIIVDFFAASSPFKNKDEESNILDRLNMSDQLNESCFIDKCYHNHLFNKKSTIMRIGDLPFVRNQELHNSIMSSSIRFHIFTPKTYEESEGTLDLSLYFNQ